MVAGMESWISPTRRKLLQSIVSGVGLALVASGVFTEAQVAPWIVVAYAALGFVTLGLAAWYAKRRDWTAIYASFAAVVAAVAAAGVVSGDVAGRVNGVAEQVFILIPVFAALVRTDTSTVSGAPASEVGSSDPG